MSGLRRMPRKPGHAFFRLVASIGVKFLDSFGEWA
jgi:hypothetical protein